MGVNTAAAKAEAPAETPIEKRADVAAWQGVICVVMLKLL
jgi:predicted protein tyrosine phosphatase